MWLTPHPHSIHTTSTLYENVVLVLLVFQTIATWAILFFVSGCEILVGRWICAVRESSQFTSWRARAESVDSGDGPEDDREGPAAETSPQADQCADEAAPPESEQSRTRAGDVADNKNAGPVRMQAEEDGEENES
jgi:hypothetical protein